MQVYVPIWKDEPHEKWKMGSKVKVYVNNGEITCIADPLNNKLGQDSLDPKHKVENNDKPQDTIHFDNMHCHAFGMHIHHTSHGIFAPIA